MSDSRGLISIIVPVYKVEKYLSRCIESILAQTYNNFEIILIDDDSPDCCPQLCDEYAKQYPNIQAVHLKNTGFGVSGARNAGLDLAKGEYLAFIDSDDYVNKDLLNFLKTILDSNPTAGMAMGSYQKVTEVTKIKEDLIDSKVKLLSDLEVMNLLIEDQNYSALWSKLFKRIIFDQLRFPEGKHNEDMFLMPYILERSQIIAYTPQRLYYYFQDNESLCRSKFNYNKLDELEAIKVWEKQSIKKYPIIVDKVKAHYYTALVNSCQFLVNRNDILGREKFKYYQSEINSEYKEIILSEFVSTNNKIKFILFKINLFRFVFRMIHILNIHKYD